MITSMMGGRAAEEFIFGEMTTGAANDFDQATHIARMMVVDYGMSIMGPINFGPTNDVTEWGRSYFEQSHLSDSTMAKIEAEIKSIVEKCYAEAVSILKKNHKALDAVAEALIKKESLDEDEFSMLVKK